jgi:acyl-CoA synthetase (NDP forming)
VIDDELRRTFRPASVAIIGASPDLASAGGRTVDMLLAHGYPGRVFPVNPRHDSIAGVPSFASIRDIGEPVDLAVIVVPAARVLDVVRDCAEAGVAGVAIFSAGFSEEGPEGEALEQEVIATARRAGMRVLGPNCQGFLDLNGSVCATFSPAADLRRGLDRAIPGNVAVISQSGALGFGIFSSGVALGMGFSRVVSCGNGADVSVLDALELTIEDDGTDVIALVLEGLSDGPRFRRLASLARERGKQIVVAKLGRSSAGSRAAASHTASLAGSSAAYDAIFERHGVIQAMDLQELIDVAMVLSRCKTAKSPRVGIVSTSGGAGVWLADACDERQLELPELGDALRARISEIAPAVTRPANPLDLTGRVISDANVAAAARAFAEDPDMDVVVLSTSLSDPLILEREREAFAALVAEHPAPLIVLTYTPPSPASIDLLSELGIPWAQSPERVARMTAHLVAGSRPLHGTELAALDDGPTVTQCADAGATVLTEPQAKALLRAWGIAVPRGELAVTAEQAEKIAKSLDGRVALKAAARDLAHKSEVGGVVLDVEPDGVGDAFAEIVARVPQPLEGVLVEEMVTQGHEVIVGALYDDTFGPFVMIGAGGIYAEVLGDVRFVPLPIDRAAALRAVDELRLAPILRGTRNQRPADVEALADLVVRVAAMVANGDVAELDLNPVVVHDEGDGVTVLDAWAVLQSPE